MGIISIPDTVVRSSGAITIIIVTFIVSSVFVRLTADRIFKLLEDEMEIERRLFFSKLYTFLIYLFALLFSLYTLGITLGNLTLVAGFITTAFALSMREVIISYFVWMILLFKRPFRIGDYIKIGDDEGQVEHIGTFYVTVDDGTDNPLRTIKIPTRLFLDRTIISYGIGDVPDVVRVKRKELPKNAEKYLVKLTADLRKLTNYPQATATLDVDGEQPVIVCRYETAFSQRAETRTKVVVRVMR
jgi:small-conductance mechanosensitive channel